MKIKINGKKYPRNLDHQVNYVYFMVDDKEFELPIIYIKRLRKNAFLADASLTQFEEYIKRHYNCEIEKVKDYFLYELRRYSNHIGLDPVSHWNLSEVKYKE